ncbi:Tautomerase-3 domain-containing protein [Aphelenchoides besseyi]|nr:Tautomerase-3 domain-containing protein [Aphelenchoides besseyi]KAI6193252.1 Tautomerase-3 domain-containing protein [Aphelenchoides besseyi]
MPFHCFFHTPGTFSQADKDELGKQINDLYVSVGLPPFYVLVLFIPIEKNDFYVGGKQNHEKFVRIGIQHIARQLSSYAMVEGFFKKYEAILAPFIKNRGLEYELLFSIAIEECDPNFWRESGLVPPISNSKAEKEWLRLNKAVPYTAEDNQP